MKIRGDKVQNRNLYALIVFMFVSMGSVGFFLFNKVSHKDLITYKLTKEEGYFIPLKIYGYSRSNAPFLEIDIGNMMVPAVIDLGFQGMLSLPSHLIEKIDKKKRIERAKSYGIKGRTYEHDVYEVESIKNGNMSFPIVKINEESLENIEEGILTGAPLQEYNYGMIGWELFSEYNLLVDCRQYILALCDSVKTLKQHGYPVEAFTETSLIPNSNFLILEAVKEKGPLRCLLDTGCTWNMLNKDWENRSNDDQIDNASNNEGSLSNLENEDSFSYNHKDTQEISSFKIEGKEFGPITFHQIKSPLQFDAILGMEFFDSHLIFIDFANNKVYIAPYPKETWPKPNLRPTIGLRRFHNVF